MEEEDGACEATCAAYSGEEGEAGKEEEGMVMQMPELSAGLKKG